MAANINSIACFSLAGNVNTLSNKYKMIEREGVDGEAWHWIGYSGESFTLNLVRYVTSMALEHTALKGLEGQRVSFEDDTGVILPRVRVVHVDILQARAIAKMIGHGYTGESGFEIRATITVKHEI